MKEIILKEFYESIFCDFLKYNNQYDNYFKNCKSHCFTYDPYDFRENTFYKNYVSDAFDWGDTYEGYELWSRIDYKWRNITNIEYKKLKYFYDNKNFLKRILLRFFKENNIYHKYILKYKEITSALVEPFPYFNAKSILDDIFNFFIIHSSKKEKFNDTWINILKSCYNK